MTVHNHGSEEGAGLACNESRLPDGSLIGACMRDEVVQLMNGRDVPKVCVDALDEYEKIWPGATFPNARPGIVAAVLSAIGYFDTTESG